MGREHSAVSAVLFVTLAHLVMGQVEFSLGDEDLNTTLDSSENSTIYGEKERNVGVWTHNRECVPGKRPDPTSCYHYFLCVENPPYVFNEYRLDCPPKLVYNPHALECVSLSFYNCDIITPLGPHPIAPPIGPPEPSLINPQIWPLPPIWPPRPIFPPPPTPSPPPPSPSPPPPPPFPIFPPPPFPIFPPPPPPIFPPPPPPIFPPPPPPLPTPPINLLRPCTAPGFLCQDQSLYSLCDSNNRMIFTGFCPTGFYCNPKCAQPCLNFVPLC